MKKNNKDKNNFEILRAISKKPNLSKHALSKQLGLSLDKLNYCIKSLQKKGLIKINNFKKNKKKLNYFYILTPKGFIEKKNLTIKFLKIKMQEYDALLKELENEKDEQ